jgi:hypothetical protein
MKSSVTTLLLCVFSVFIINGCSNNKHVVEIPVWTTERPINSSYYIGISAASKVENPYSAIDVARENALNSIAREIRVNVSSSSVLSTLQVNKWVEESFASTITSTVAEELEGYVLVDTFEDEDEVWVYYRLSKSEYARILQERKREALGKAYGHYLDAQKLVSDGELPVAVERFIMGLDAMRKYLGELNPYTGEDGVEFDLDRALLNGLSDGITNLKISSSTDAITLLLANKYKGEINVEVRYEGRLISGVPLTYKYSRGMIPARGSTSTSGDGKALITIGNFDAGSTRSELEISISVAALVKILQPLSPLKPLVEGLKAPPLLIPIRLESPKIYVVGSEKLFGIELAEKTLIPSIKAALMANGVEVMDRKSADALTLTVQANTTLSGQGRGFFTAYLNAVFELKNSSGDLVMHKSLDRVKGVQTDKTRAGQEAYRKATKEIETRFIESFIKALYK